MRCGQSIVSNGSPFELQLAEHISPLRANIQKMRYQIEQQGALLGSSRLRFSISANDSKMRTLKIWHWGLFYIHDGELSKLSELLGIFVCLVSCSWTNTNLLSHLIDPVRGAVA